MRYYTLSSKLEILMESLWKPFLFMKESLSPPSRKKQEYLKENDYLKELFTDIINHIPGSIIERNSQTLNVVSRFEYIEFLVMTKNISSLTCSSKLSLETKMVYERVFESTHTRKQSI